MRKTSTPTSMMSKQEKKKATFSINKIGVHLFVDSKLLCSGYVLIFHLLLRRMKFDNIYRDFSCHCKLYQCNVVSRWCWRLPATLIEFLKLGPQPLSL